MPATAATTGTATGAVAATATAPATATVSAVQTVHGLCQLAVTARDRSSLHMSELLVGGRREVLVSYPRGCRPSHPFGPVAPPLRDRARRPAHEARRLQSRGPMVRRPHAAFEHMVERQVQDGLYWPDAPPERKLCVAAPTARRDAPGRGILHVAEAAPAALWLTGVLARAALPEPLLATAGALQVARLARQAAQTRGARPCEPPVLPGRRAPPARDRVAGLLVDQARGPVGRSPPEGHRLVRDPSAGRHVPGAHQGSVDCLTVARWW